LLRRRLLDPHLDDLTAAMSRSLSTAMVLAPPNLLPALSRLTEAMNVADQRDEGGGHDGTLRGPQLLPPVP
jgi:hypothetical protein